MAAMLRQLNGHNLHLSPSLWLTTASLLFFFVAFPHAHTTVMVLTRQTQLWQRRNKLLTKRQKASAQVRFFMLSLW